MNEILSEIVQIRYVLIFLIVAAPEPQLETIRYIGHLRTSVFQMNDYFIKHSVLNLISF